MFVSLSKKRARFWGLVSNTVKGVERRRENAMTCRSQTRDFEWDVFVGRQSNRSADLVGIRTREDSRVITPPKRRERTADREDEQSKSGWSVRCESMVSVTTRGGLIAEGG